MGIARVLIAKCEECGARLQVHTRQASKVVACPKCKSEVYASIEAAEKPIQAIARSPMDTGTLDPSLRATILDTASNTLGVDAFNKLVRSVSETRQRGRLQYWQEELLADVSDAAEQRIDYSFFLAVFEGAAEAVSSVDEVAPTTDPDAQRGKALAALFNSLGEQATNNHPADPDAAASEVVTHLELLSTCSSCESCYSLAPTKKVSFVQLIGLVIFFHIREIKGNLCKTCINTYYTDYTTITALAGWWSVTAFITPLALIWNTVNYLRCISLKPGPYQRLRSDIGPIVAMILAAAPFIAVIVCYIAAKLT